MKVNQSCPISQGEPAQPSADLSGNERKNQHFHPSAAGNKDGSATRLTIPHPTGRLQSGFQTAHGEPVEPSADLSGFERKRSEMIGKITIFTPSRARDGNASTTRLTNPPLPDDRKAVSKPQYGEPVEPSADLSGNARK